MSANQFPPIRRPQHFEVLLQTLVGASGVFETMRDALIFCAGLGFSASSRLPLGRNAGSIEWTTMMANPMFEEIRLLITAAGAVDEPDRLGENSVAQSVILFEEFATGGLALIDDERTKRGGTVVDIITRLITQRFSVIPDEEGGKIEL